MNNIRLISPSNHSHFSIIFSNFSVFDRLELGPSLKFIRLKSNNHFGAVFPVAAMEVNIMLILLTSLPLTLPRKHMENPALLHPLSSFVALRKASKDDKSRFGNQLSPEALFFTGI